MVLIEVNYKRHLYRCISYIVFILGLFIGKKSKKRLITENFQEPKNRKKIIRTESKSKYKKKTKNRDTTKNQK